MKTNPVDAIFEFTGLILHGDVAHRNWLVEAAEAYVEGKELPPPRDLNNSQLAHERTDIQPPETQ